MGLDMYLFKCIKPSLNKNSIITDEQEISYNKLNYVFFNDLPLVKTIVDNTVSVIREQQIFNREKIYLAICEKDKLDYISELENDIKYNGKSDNGSCSFTFDEILSNDGIEYVSKHTISISKEELSSYLLLERKNVFAIIMEQIAYQRKGLDDLGWDLMACDNCEYTDDYDLVADMERGGLEKEFIDSWILEKTVFQPWW